MILPCPELAGLLLAAGGSTRMGEAKQLISWHDMTLVERAAEALLSLCGGDVVVVTGHEAQQVNAALVGRRVCVVKNNDWQSGMAGSIKTGRDAILVGEPRAVLIMLCDQPLVTESDLRRLVDVWQNHPAQPVAAGYSGTVGVPAILPLALLSKARLKADAGARALLRGRDDVLRVDMPNAALDIDTPDDLRKLRINK